MKILLGVLFASLLSLAAQAAEVTGRAELTLWPDTATGSYLDTSIRQEGNKILGQTFLGNGVVYLEMNNGRYQGFTGGSGTDLKCDGSKCTGMINGNSANFSTQERVVDGGREMSSQGSVNFHSVTTTRTAKKITVSGDGSVDMTATREGVYEGHIYVVNSRGIGSYTARLVTSGTLLNLSDSALFNIFMVAPFNQR